MTSGRQQAGRKAEERAEKFLCAGGFRIVERNYRCRRGELDLVAYDGDCLVFVEVRSRGDDRFGGALAAVGPKKQRQVARVAEIYLAQKRLTPLRCRFDVVGVTGDAIEHVVDAFRPL